MIDLDVAARRWQTEGWVLIDGLIPADDIAAARAEVPSGDVAEPTSASSPSRRRYTAAEQAVRGDEPAFRRAQFSGTTLFPVPDAPTLNRLFVHPHLIDFASRALQTADLRIYQSRIWSKYAGRANYSQPHHRDLNHSLVPTRSEPGWWHLECFLYLTDVEHDTGAPRVVPKAAVGVEPVPPTPQLPEDAPGFYEVEVPAVGRAGSLFAYRSDTWHRGADIARPGTERHVLVVAFKPGGVEWIGYDPHPPLSVNDDFRRFVVGATPAQLALFGVPRPGHPYWTPAMVDAMAIQYPGLDVEPWRDQLSTAQGTSQA